MSRERNETAALLDRHLERIRYWTSRSHRGGAWRHSDFYRHRRTGAHLSTWHTSTRECRDAIAHVRALRRALAALDARPGDRPGDLSGQ